MADRIEVGNGSTFSEMGGRQHRSRPLGKLEVWGRVIQGKATELNNKLHGLLGMVPPDNSFKETVDPSSIGFIDARKRTDSINFSSDVDSVVPGNVVAEVTGKVGPDTTPIITAEDPKVYDREKEPAVDKPYDHEGTKI